MALLRPQRYSAVCLFLKTASCACKGGGANAFPAVDRRRWGPTRHLLDTCQNHLPAPSPLESFLCRKDRLTEENLAGFQYFEGHPGMPLRLRIAVGSGM